MVKLILRNKLFFNQLKQLHVNPVIFNKPSFVSAKEKNDFKNVFNPLVTSLITNTKFAEVPEIGNYVKQVFDYTTSGGKLSRGLCVSTAYQMLEDPKDLKEENLHTARVLGWCLEMAWFLLIDDMLDGSITRRGKTCWYRLPHVGTSALIDVLLMNQSIIEILEIHFGNKPFYLDVIKCFNEAILYTSIGEYLDCKTTYSKEKDTIELFTTERYNAAAKYKSGYFSFRLPIGLALLLMKDSNNKNITKEWSDLCLELGLFIQFKNDYADVYGDNAVTGKIGSDITEGKCTWLSVTALKLCNKNQRSIFKEYYGSKETEHIEQIKKLYDDLQLPSIFKKQANERYSGILQRINDLPTEGERKFFTKLLNAINNDQF